MTRENDDIYVKVQNRQMLAGAIHEVVALNKQFKGVDYIPPEIAQKVKSSVKEKLDASPVLLPVRTGKFSVVLLDGNGKDEDYIAQALHAILCFAQIDGYYAASHVPCALIRHLHFCIAEIICDKLKEQGLTVQIVKEPFNEAEITQIVGDELILISDRYDSQLTAATLSEIFLFSVEEAAIICGKLPCAFITEIPVATARYFSSQLLKRGLIARPEHMLGIETNPSRKGLRWTEEFWDKKLPMD